MKRLGIVLLATMIALLLGFKSKTASTEQVWLYWDINSSLGLPGGPTADQVAAGDPPRFSTREIDILRDAEKMACGRYDKTLALFRAKQPGGELEKLDACGYALSMVQARLAWASDRPVEAVARLDQAVSFSREHSMASQAAYNAGQVTLTQLISASERGTFAKQSLERVRSALARLGVDLKEVSKQLQIDLDHQSPKAECHAEP